MRRRRRPASGRDTALRLAGASLLLGALIGTALPAAAQDPSSGTPISVNIVDGSTSSPTPSPSASVDASAGPGSTAPGSAPGTGGTGGFGSGSGSGSAGGGTPVTGGGTGGSSGTTPPPDEVNVAGILYVGGVNASATPSWNPADGTVDVWFTVRNASGSAIDATAQFWVDGAVFGNRLDTVDEVPVTALQPGETRVVAAQLRNGGQWTLLSAHVTLVPPESVEGSALTSVSRDALVVLFPWLLVLVAVLLVLAVVAVRVIRAAAGPAPVPAVAT